MTFWHLICIYAAGVAAAYLVGRARLAKVDAGARYPALHIAKYVLGSFLSISVGLIVFLLSNTAACTDGLRKDGVLQIYDACKNTRRWYSVLTDWQSGIGAFIGLLGLAWSTLLSALMDKSKLTEGT